MKYRSIIIIIVLFFIKILWVFPLGGPDRDHVFNDLYSDDMLAYYLRDRKHQYTDLGRGLYLHHIYRPTEAGNFEYDYSLINYNLNYNTPIEGIRFKQISDRYLSNYVVFINKDSIEIQNKRENNANSKFIFHFNEHDILLDVELFLEIDVSIYGVVLYEFVYEDNKLKQIYEIETNSSGHRFEKLETEFIYNITKTNIEDFITFEADWNKKNDTVIYENGKLSYFIKIVDEAPSLWRHQWHYTIYEYNENGIIIKETHYHLDANMNEVWSLNEIEYDERKNWIYYQYISTKSSSSYGPNEVTRKIVYK